MPLIVHYHFPCGHTDSEVYGEIHEYRQTEEQDVVMDGTCLCCRVKDLEQMTEECCEMALEERERELEMAWDV